LAGLALWLSPANPKGVALLFVWSCLLLGATCFGAPETPYRYLHPFSFMGLAATAVLFDKLAGFSFRPASWRAASSVPMDNLC
jgi:hypothetical protein